MITILKILAILETAILILGNMNLNFTYRACLLCQGTLFLLISIIYAYYLDKQEE